MQINTKLIFPSNALQIVATASSLEAILSIYNVMVESEFANSCREEFALGEYRRRCADSIDALRRHVAESLLAGDYKSLIAHATVEEHDDPDAPSDESLLIEEITPALGMLELLQCTPEKNAVFVCDDRHLTGYPTIGVAPLIGVFEVLRVLRRSGQLSDSEYFDKMLRLRRSAAMFLPLEKDEVMFHLLGAPVVDGAVRETDELVTLRRYVAHIVILEQHLKIGDYPANLVGHPDETWVLLALRRLVDDCLVAVWKSCALDDEQAMAKAEWLWSSMRVERHLGNHPSIRNDREGVRTYAAVTICSAICTAFQLVAGVSETRQNAFALWLEDAVAGRLDADTNLCQKVDEQLAMLIQGLSLDPVDQDGIAHASDTTAAYFRQALAMFPEKIRQRLESDSTLRSLLKTRTVSVVTVGAVSIERGAFFQAVEKAIKFGRSVTQVEGAATKVKFRRLGAGLSLRAEGNEYRIDDEAFCIFSKTPDELGAVLRQHPEWFECGVSEREHIISQILRLPDAQQRFASADTARRSTLRHRCDTLRQKLFDNGRLPVASFGVPPPNEVLNHLRLTKDSDASFNVRWELAAQALIGDFGLQECFIRLASLPIPLPLAFRDEFSRAGLEVQQALLMNWSGFAGKSPTHFIHALSLLRPHSEASPVTETYGKIASLVLERWDVLGDAMGALLTWSEANARTMSDWRGVDDTARIVAFWLHASNLMILLNNTADSASLIAERFRAFKTALSPEAALGQLAMAKDIASASAHTSIGLLYCGLNYVIGSGASHDVLSAEQWSQVASLMRVSETVNPWMLVSRESASNLTGAFLKFSHADLPGQILVTSESIGQFEGALVELLESNPNSTTGWIHVHALSRIGLSTAVVQRIPALLEHADMIELSGQLEYPYFGCRALAGCVSFYGTTELREKVANQIVQLAERFAFQHRKNLAPVEFNTVDPRGTSLTELIEASLLLCRTNDVTEGFRAFASLSSRVVTAWPAATKAMRGLLGQIYSDSLLDDNAEIWHEYLRLRARQ
ncbi:hypothetical protein G3N58_21035 [Paraburkholderia sp. Ac-20342]|uniref:hypothetical protein n=1 Tax=Paraburkholderia sp. Ac-20342 TaxID=2703889 RepID=UPI0019816EC6|nr:hypothetical protein [Paraburkholderia sp. Ac-20342]MBN3849291.1 hypothetical protein [Paraburkholderia sp. Ac-20342]